MPYKDYRKESKGNWGINIPEDKNLNIDQLKLGAILRIADATEVMAKNYTQLQRDLEQYKRWYDLEVEKRKMLIKQNSSLRGVITKLKNKLNGK